MEQFCLLHAEDRESSKKRILNLNSTVCERKSEAYDALERNRKHALYACCEQTEGKRIILLKSKADEDSFFLHIENSYNGEALLSKNGVFVSSKAHGSGLGLASIKAIVQRYNGIFETSQDNGRFAVSVFLNIPQQNQ